MGDTTTGKQTNDQKTHEVGSSKPPTTATRDSLFSVQPPFNSPIYIGLRYSEVLDCTIKVPQINEESVTTSQVASIIVRNMETFERDRAEEACTRTGCAAPAACYLQRSKEQSNHLLLYHYLQCIQVMPPRKNLLSRTKRYK